MEGSILGALGRDAESTSDANGVVDDDAYVDALDGNKFRKLRRGPAMVVVRNSAFMPICGPEARERRLIRTTCLFLSPPSPLFVSRSLNFPGTIRLIQVNQAVHTKLLSLP